MKNVFTPIIQKVNQAFIEYATCPTFLLARLHNCKFC